jgi:hypothetical protein
MSSEYNFYTTAEVQNGGAQRKKKSSIHKNLHLKT